MLSPAEGLPAGSSVPPGMPAKGQMNSHTVTVGVVGHRSLEHQAVLRATVQCVLDDIVNIHGCGGQSHPHLCCLSSLAEGADRLVAEEVLKRPGACLKVVLPLTVRDYLEDFATDESRRQFHALLERDPAPVMLSRENLSDVCAPQDLLKVRRQAYARAGRCVVDACTVLLGIWDGQPARGIGGTAQSIEHARRQRRPLYLIDTNSPGRFSSTERRAG